MAVAGCASRGPVVTISLPTPLPAGTVLAACARLVNHLPPKLAGEPSRVVEPRSPLVHAWGSPPIVMRCGVPKPATFRSTAPGTVDVDGVTWFQRVGRETVTWTALRDTANIELVVPTSYEGQGGFLVELGTSIKAAVP